MTERQLDLFADAGTDIAQPTPPSTCASPVAADMNDAALIAAIPESVLSDSANLAAEAGRRRLAAAVPALASLCRRFAGFGLDRAVPEQVAALRGLAEIGGRDAADAVVQLIDRAVVCGQALKIALDTAARLRARLSEGVLRSLLAHADPVIRADACRCSRPFPDVIARLIDLLNDSDPTVARSAACALGRMGRIEARPIINDLLRQAPSTDVIDAAASIANDDSLVLLGRIARAGSSLSASALDVLEEMDDARAAAIAAAVRSRRCPDKNHKG